MRSLRILRRRIGVVWRSLRGARVRAESGNGEGPSQDASDLVRVNGALRADGPVARRAGEPPVTANEYASMLDESLRRERALREADRRKDRFLATLAHELRGPLAPLRNSLEIIKCAGDRASLVEQSVATMERQLQHMVRLVDDLLDISRIVNDKLVLKCERVDIAALVQHAVEAARPQVDAGCHALQVELPREPVQVSGDAMRLSQVLANLLGNAAKYTDRPGQISLRVHREGGQVVVRVKDSGIGIARERLPELFQIFHQLDTSLEQSRGGLGIGLALARRIVQMHGGTVEAFSEGLGQGAEFVVRLPALD